MVEADDEVCLVFDWGIGKVVGDVSQRFGAEVPLREEVVDYGGDVVFGVADGDFGRFYG